MTRRKKRQSLLQIRSMKRDEVGGTRCREMRSLVRLLNENWKNIGLEPVSSSTFLKLGQEM